MNAEVPFSNRIEELYRVLSEAEKRTFTRYLSSPYFIRDKNLLPFHQFLIKEQPDEVRYNKNKAWQSVFGKIIYNEKKFRYLVSDLTAAIEEFIYTQQVLNQKPGYIQLVDEYYSLHDASISRAALATKIRNGTKTKRQVINPAYFLEKHFENELLEELHTTSLKEYARHVTGKRDAGPGGLDVYYAIEKLRQMCFVANDNNVFGKTEQCFNQDEVIQLASRADVFSNVFIQAYRHVFEMLTHKREFNYYGLKEIIHQAGYEMEDRFLAELLTYARNFCIAQVNAGNSSFFEELFDLYKEGLAKRVLLLNGEINERNYKNIVTTALRTGKYEWTLEFINDYRYNLNKAVRDNAYNYNLANYFFHTRQYDRVLRNLQKVHLGDLFYGLDARSLMIKCYYETDEREAFMNAYESFRVFVQRRKNVSEQHRRNYLNFLRIAKKLMNIRPRNKKGIEKIVTEIKTSKAIADKNWLEEKVSVYV